MVDVTSYYSDDLVTLHEGDALTVLRELAPASVDCIVTSPPYYGLRDYGIDGQYGLEASPAEYVETMRAVFAECRRVLAADGTLWLNLGDSYVSNGGASGRMASNLGTAVLERPEARDPEKFGRWNRQWGLAPKNLLGIPWRVAFALQDDGWTLRNAVVWHKPNAMPESVTDRLSCDYEHVFLFSRSRTYYFDLDAIREPLSYPDAADGSRVFGGANKGTEGVIDATERRRGGNTYGGKTWAERKALGEPSRHGLEGAAAAAPGVATVFAPHPAGKNPGSVWDVVTQPFPSAHFAVMPVRLADRCIRAGCKPGGVVLDPFSGSGTTGLAAGASGRRYVGIDLNRDYLDLSLRTRLAQTALMDCDPSPKSPTTDEVVA